MKTRNLVTLTLVICVLVVFTACQKVADIQLDKPVLPSLNVTESNWNFQSLDSSFKGIVDTAYTINNEGINNIVIEGSDTSGNVISILLSTSEKKFTKDAYTSLYGRAFISFQADTSYYASYKDSGSCTFEITKITDSVIEGNYKAVLLDKEHHKTITIASGSIKAFLNKGSGAGNSEQPGTDNPADGAAYYWSFDGVVYPADIISHDSVDIYNDWAAFCLEDNGNNMTIEFNSHAVKDGIYNITNVNGYLMLDDNQARIYYYNNNPPAAYYMAQSGTITVATTNSIRTASFSNVIFKEQSENEEIPLKTKTISGFINLKP